MKKYLTMIFVLLVLCAFTTSCYSDEASEWYRKGVSYYDEGLDGKAIECLSKSLELNPDNPDAYYLRGNSYFTTYRLEKAISDFTKFIESNPKSPSGYYWRGRSYNAKRDHEKAIVDYDRAIELDPENSEYYIDRGMLYDNNSEIYGLDEAERDYRKACDLGNFSGCNHLRSLY